MDDRVMALLVDLHRTLELPAARLRPQAALEQPELVGDGEQRATRHPLADSGRGVRRVSRSQPSPPAEPRIRRYSSPSSGSWPRPVRAVSSWRSLRSAAESLPGTLRRNEEKEPGRCSRRTVSTWSNSVVSPSSVLGRRPGTLTSGYTATAVRSPSSARSGPDQEKRTAQGPLPEDSSTCRPSTRRSSSPQNASRPGRTSHSSVTRGFWVGLAAGCRRRPAAALARVSLGGSRGRRAPAIGPPDCASNVAGGSQPTPPAGPYPQRASAAPSARRP